MLARANRLRNSREFRRVYEEGHKAPGHLTIFRFRRATQGTPTRIGIIVSTKVSKKAVVRNRLKRQLRDATRRALSGLPDSLDIVVTARPQAAAKPFSMILDDCRSIARRIMSTAQKM